MMRDRRAIAAIVALRQARLRRVEREIAELDRAVEAARAAEDRARRFAAVQAQAFDQTESANRERLIGSELPSQHLTARISSLRRLRSQLAAAKALAEAAGAETKNREALRQAAQPRLRAAHSDLERWREQAAHLTRVSAIRQAGAEEQMAEDEAQDRWSNPLVVS